MTKFSFAAAMTLAVGIFATGSQAHAKCRWYKCPGHHVGKRLDKVLDVTADVVTFGEHGRDRDDARAGAAKQVAQQAEANANQARANKIQELRNYAAQSKEMKVTLESYKQTLGFLKTRFESNMQLTSSLVADASASALRSESLNAVINIQRKDLGDWVARLEKQFQDDESQKDQEVQNISKALHDEVVVYFDQLQNLPQRQGANLDANIEGALELGFECMELLNQLSASNDAKIAAAQAKADDYEAQIARL